MPASLAAAPPTASCVTPAGGHSARHDIKYLALGSWNLYSDQTPRSRGYPALDSHSTTAWPAGQTMLGVSMRSICQLSGHSEAGHSCVRARSCRVRQMITIPALSHHHAVKHKAHAPPRMVRITTLTRAMRQRFWPRVLRGGLRKAARPLCGATSTQLHLCNPGHEYRALQLTSWRKGRRRPPHPVPSPAPLLVADCHTASVVASSASASTRSRRRAAKTRPPRIL